MPAPHLTIRRFALGQWMTNCYVLHAPGTGGAAPARGRECWIIDAGFEPGPMIEYIQEQKLMPRQVILTHAHLDHIAGLNLIRGTWPQVGILVHREEQEFLTEPELNLSADFDEPVITPPATGLLSHGQRLELEGLVFEVRHIPGHSPGGVCLYQAQAAAVFVGDVLFNGGIGRYDFPTSDAERLVDSIRTQLYTLPDATRVYPGHGPATTVGQEKGHNPYVRAE